jgi:organic radical activating enzyme
MGTDLWYTSSGLTVQGTGHLAGVVQYFIRLSGCDHKGCQIRALCDEARSFSFHAGSKTTVRQIVDRALEELGHGGWLHITGGEPTQNPAFYPLIREASEAGLKVHIQTSGIAGIEAPYDWLTVSPKTPLSALRQTYGQEMVVVYQGQSDEELLEMSRSTGFWYYYLSPLWLPGANEMENARATADAVIRLNRRSNDDGLQRHHNGRQWLAALQAHKFWGVK